MFRFREKIQRNLGYKGKFIMILISLFVVSIIIFFHIKGTRAANITWDGGGINANWSTCANWVGDVCPGVNDIAIFDSTSTKDATIDATFTGTVAGLQINTGYSGTITQARDLTVSNGGANGFKQATGTFAQASYTLTLYSSNFTKTGGVFNAGTGTVAFTGLGDITLNANGSQDFNNFTFNRVANAFFVASGTTVTVNGLLTFSGGGNIIYGPGVIDAKGNIVQESSFNYGFSSVRVNFANDSVAQTYTINGGKGPYLYLDSAADANDTIVFNADGELYGLNITSGFSGTVGTTYNSHNLTLENGGFTQAAGTFVAPPTLTFSVGTLTKSGGTFTAGTGTVTWVGGGDQVFNANGSIDLNNLTFNKNANAFTVASGTTIAVNGLLTFSGGGNQIFGPGIIDAKGDVVQNSSFNYGGNTVRVNFANDSVAQTYTINGGKGPYLYLDSAADANDAIVFNADGELYGLNITSGFSGTFSPTYNSHNLTLGVGGFTLGGGTFVAPSILTFSGGSFTKTGGTFSYGTGTVTWIGGGDQTFNANGSIDLYNLTFAKSANAFTFANGTTVTVNGLLTFSGGGNVIYGPGIIDAKGNIVQDSSFNYGNSNVRVNFANDSAAQTYTINGGKGPYLYLDSAADANDAIVLNADGSLYGLNITGTFSGTVNTVYNSHTFTIESGGFTQASGTFTAPDNLVLNGASNFTKSGGTFDAGTGTVTYTNNGDATVNANGSQTFYNFVINRTANAFTIAGGTTLVINGTLTFGGTSYIVYGPGGFDAKGNVTVSGNLVSSSAPVSFSGTAPLQTFDLTTYTDKLDGDITVNKSSGEVRLASALVMNGANQDLILTSGIFNLNGKNLTVNGSSGTFTVASGATFKMQGGETLTLNSGYPTLATGSTVTYTGDGDGASDSYELQDWGYKNLDIALTDSADSVSTNNIITDPSTGLQSHWAMDETVGGSSVADSSGTNTGTPQGTTGVNNKPQPSTDVPPVSFSDARSLNFDGTDDYVSTATQYNNPQLFSISLWFKTGTASGHKMFGFENVQTGTGASLADRTLYIGTDGKLYYGWYPGSIVVIASTGTVTDNNWHNAIVTFSGTSASLYLDGQFQSSNNSGAAANYAGYWRMGGYKWNGWTNGSDGYYTGNLDDVKLYNRVLTAADIADLSSGAAPSGPTLNVAGNLILESGSFTPSVNIKITGNLTNTAGTFNASAGILTMNGTSQTISGSNTFYGFTKAVTSADTLTFGASSTTTVKNALTLTGTSGHVLSLRSSADGTRWSIDPQGTRTIQYLDVKDSNNINATAMNITGQNINDSGNNLNWGFDSTAPVRSAGSPTGSIASGTTSTTISLTTDENATCKYSTSAGTAYASMTNTFGTTGTTSHSTTVSGLVDGGSYTYYVRCVDGSSNANTDDYAISFSVSDGQSPTVSVTAPNDSDTVSGTVTVTATASDNVSVTGVQFKLDGANLGAEDTAAPYSISWDSTTATNAAHILTAVARDDAGNSTTSSGINVTVQNDSSAPVISGTNTISLPAGTKLINISLTTDESATCKYSTSAGTAYASMTNTFDTTGSTSHSTTVQNLNDGQTYRYYARCIDAYSNANASDYEITVTIQSGGAVIDPAALMPPTPPDGGFRVVINNGAPVTNNRVVNLSMVYGHDTVSMAVSTLSDLSDVGIKPASPTAFFDLCKTSQCKPGHYTVYAKFYTKYGRSTPVIESSITLTDSHANIPETPAIPAIPSVPTASNNQGSPYYFSRDLRVGSTGADVKELQKYLNNQGFMVSLKGAGSPGHETTLFGAATKKALIRFQEYFKNEILVPAGLTKGTGLFSKFTRLFVNGGQ